MGFALQLRTQLYTASRRHMSEAFPAVAQTLAHICDHVDAFCTGKFDNETGEALWPSPAGK